MAEAEKKEGWAMTETREAADVRFAEMAVAELDADIVSLCHMQALCGELLERNTESGKGSCILDGIEVLLAKTVECYTSERDIWKERAVKRG